MNYTKQLAEFAAGLQYSALPPSVIEKAKEIALHAWSVQMAGSTLPWSKAVYRYVLAQGGLPKSTILNYGKKTSPVHAALVNGTFGHGFEMDDNHAATGTKGGCVALPAVLAIGEQQSSTGKDVILAIVIAYEVMTRVSLSMQPDLLKGAHHPTGTCGPLGAAAAAGKLLGFDAERMCHALSIAAGHSSGLTEAPAEGRGSLKRIFGGVAASNGIRSALLAAEGLTGPATNLEGKRGLCAGVTANPNLDALTSGLGKEWQILKVHYKIYAQDGYIQPMTEALDYLVKQHKFKPGDIAHIRAGTNKHAMDVVSLIREPNDVTSAQFSANYSLALFLIKGNAGFQEYTEANIKDPEIIALSRKIRAEVDDEIEAEWQKSRPRGARITVTLNSGASYTHCVHMLRSMSREDVDGKSRRLLSVVMSADKAQRLIDTARNLDQVSNISLVCPLLSCD